MTLALDKRYFKYIAFHYLKNFFILLFGLTFAVTFIDFLQNLKHLDVGANLKVLYIFYSWEMMTQLLYPLVLALAFIWTYINFIKANTLTALYSFGFSKKEILHPFLFSSFSVYILFMVLNTTPFAYGKNYSSAILHKRLSQERLEKIFFKYNGDFVYIRELNPVKAVLNGVTIFHIKKDRLKSITDIPIANYKQNRWISKRAKIRELRFNKAGQISGFRDLNIEKVSILQGYKPHIVNLIYEGRSLTIQDSVLAWLLLKKQNLDSSKVLANLYNIVLMPLFAIAMISILFFRIPPYKRFIKQDSLIAYSIGSVMLIWALLFAFYRLASSGVINPTFIQAFPIVLLMLFAIKDYIKQRD